MAVQLTGRERVTRMFARDDHDRVPRYDSYWPDTLANWRTSHGIAGEDAVLDILESDFHSAGVVWPEPYPGQRVVLSKTDETVLVRNGWGATIREWKHKDGTPEHVGFDCDTREKWETVYKPAYLNGQIQADIPTIRQRHAEGRRKDRWCLLHCAESFEVLRKMLGDEIMLVSMAFDPEWIADVSRTYTDHLLREFDAILHAGLAFDGIFMWGDMAYNHSTFCSPRMYRELVWPDHKRIADWVHAHDMRIIYHTDGNVNNVMPLYVDAGFDCLQPLEAKASMDLRHLAPQYGDTLGFMGNVDIMQMIDNDRDKIEAEVRAKLAAGKATQHYAYHSDHSIPPQVTWEM